MGPDENGQGRFRGYIMGQGLLLIDIQNDYFSGGRNELHGMEAAAQQARRALEHFRAQGLPVFHVQHISLYPSATFFLPDTDGAAIHELVAPLPGEPVVVKHAPNSFFETGLKELLDRHEVGRLVVCGSMSHMCVDTTVRAARDFALPVTLLHDACATRDLGWSGQTVPAQQVQAAYMAALNGSFATVLSADDYLAGER